jgi:hypothetical protein
MKLTDKKCYFFFQIRDLRFQTRRCIRVSTHTVSLDPRFTVYLWTRSDMNYPPMRYELPTFTNPLGIQFHRSFIFLSTNNQIMGAFYKNFFKKRWFGANCHRLWRRPRKSAYYERSLHCRYKTSWRITIKWFSTTDGVITRTHLPPTNGASERQAGNQSSR